MNRTLFITAAVLLLGGSAALAQQNDSLAAQKLSYYRKALSTNKETAQQVMTVLDDYKAATVKIMTQQELTDDQKRLKINLLIHDKVVTLKSLLNNKQLQKIIPTSEINN